MAISQQGKLLLGALQISQNQQPSAAALNLLKRAVFGDLSHIGQVEYGIPVDRFKYMIIFLAQGTQWAHEKWPHIPGPKGIYFGSQSKNEIYLPNTVRGVLADDKRMRLPDGADEIGLAARIMTMPNADPAQPDECKVTVNFDFVKQQIEKSQKKEWQVPLAQSRQCLGQLTAEEVMFLCGVEEYAHAMQAQDADEKKKYACPHSGQGHDDDPKELAIVPFLQEALAAFRTRNHSGPPAAGR
jgi:hypothetical protein